jgi:hypothetical protein
MSKITKIGLMEYCITTAIGNLRMEIPFFHFSIITF